MIQLFDVADVFFISKWWFCYYRNGAWNLLNWRIIGILVFGLSVRFHWISKKFTGKSGFRANFYVVNGLHSENNRAIPWQIWFSKNPKRFSKNDCLEYHYFLSTIIIIIIIIVIIFIITMVIMVIMIIILIIIINIIFNIRSIII